MNQNKIICIAEGKHIIFTSDCVMFPDGESIQYVHSGKLSIRLIEILNEVKAIRSVWIDVADAIGYTQSKFLMYRTMPWRNGSHSSQGRTIYHNNKLCGMMDTPELAKKVVDALNEKEP